MPLTHFELQEHMNRRSEAYLSKLIVCVMYDAVERVLEHRSVILMACAGFSPDSHHFTAIERYLIPWCFYLAPTITGRV